MSVKDYSLSKKHGWQEYKAKTWLLLPKLFNSDFWSYFIYGLFLLKCYILYRIGGLEKALKLEFWLIKEVIKLVE